MLIKPAISFNLTPMQAQVYVRRGNNFHLLNILPCVTVDLSSTDQRLRVQCNFDPTGLPEYQRFITPGDEQFRRPIERHLRQALPAQCEHIYLCYTDYSQSGSGTATLASHHRDNEMIDSVSNHEWMELISQSEALNVSV